MIQDIYPSKLHNEYIPAEMKEGDALLIFDREGRILLGGSGGKIIFPVCTDKADQCRADTNSVYLFSLDEKRFFLLLFPLMEDKDYREKGFAFYSIREVRDTFCGKEVFAVFTAYHLWKWYSDNRYCGRCSADLCLDEKERALRCPECDNVIYPRINPAVIVGVVRGDCLLITKYRRGYAHSALVAGFTEIGETFEETVSREVMEETGVKVKNIRYYKSQPWGMAQDILAGFFCEADGDGEIHMDETELKYAEWVKREDIVLQPNDLSLTNEMMKVFKDREIFLNRNDEGF